MTAVECACAAASHDPRLIVLTGGPGAGKTAVLEVVRRTLCRHVAVLPESASVLFGGGFPRHASDAGRRRAQRAIFHVQREMEQIYVDERSVAIVLCDRGTLDGAAYWPEGVDALARELQIDRPAELARYAAVIHLRTPPAARGYDHSNPVRVESADEARRVDERIALAWEGHPRRFFIGSEDTFLTKVGRAVAVVRDELPICCRRHPIAELGESGVGDCPECAPPDPKG